MITNSSNKRSLGQTGYQVTPVGLGIMQFSGASGVFKMVFSDLSQQEMTAIIKTAIDGGINWFDTAEMYGQGKSERGLANALKELDVEDGQVIIGTKWFPIMRTASNIPRTIDDRIKYLDGYTIDLYMVHQPWGFSSPEKEMAAMADLVDAGKIRSVGVSNFNQDQMVRAHRALEKRGIPLAVNQVQYSLLHRKIETNGVLDAAKDLGITIVAWSPLARGILSGKYYNDPEAYNKLPLGRKVMMRGQIQDSLKVAAEQTRLAEKYQVTPSQVALNWLINAHGETVVAIPGASKVYQAAEAAGTMQFNLSPEDLAQLDEVSREFR